VNVGVIGLGSIGVRHARNVLALGHRPWVFDARPFTQTIEGLTQTNRLFDVADNAEAMLICTPAHTHTSVLLQLREAGYAGPLFVEKPICDTLVDKRHWDAWPHLTTMVGYNLRFHPAARALKAYRHPTGGGFYIDCDSRQWPGAAYANVALECSHELDLALWLGAPADVQTCNVYGFHRVTIWLGDGDRWLVDLDDRCEAYLRHWMLGGPEPVPPVVKFHAPEELGEQMYVDELAHFLDCAANGLPTITPFADGLRVLDVLAQAQHLAGVLA
jgi:predicted dehydrogenase